MSYSCYFTKGKILVAKKDILGASKAFEESLNIRKQTIPGHYLIGLTHHKRGQLEAMEGRVKQSM
jgi:hypothetical protein